VVLNRQVAVAHVCIVLYDGALVSDTHQSLGTVRWYGSEVPGFASRPKAWVSVKVPIGVWLDDSLAWPIPADPTHAFTGPYTTRQVPVLLFCQARSVPLVAVFDGAVTVINWVAFPGVTGMPKLALGTGAIDVFGAAVGAAVFWAVVCGAVVAAGALVRAGADGDGGCVGAVSVGAAGAVRAARVMVELSGAVEMRGAAVPGDDGDPNGIPRIGEPRV
jgi:hypothetical protein